RPRASVSAQLDALEAVYGTLQPTWPTDSYLFLVWWHCGYPASDDRCNKGWQALHDRLGGVEPDRRLGVRAASLTSALRAGGLIPQARAQRLREVASRAATLTQLAGKEGRKLLMSFPGIGGPGADRIQLFSGVAPVAAVPSNGTQVLVRMQLNKDRQRFDQDYAAGQALLDAAIAHSCAAR